MKQTIRVVQEEELGWEKKKGTWLKTSCAVKRWRGEKRLWQHDSWFIDFFFRLLFFFFYPGLLEKSKAISGFVDRFCIPLANGHATEHAHYTHTQQSNNQRARTQGGVFNPQIHDHKSNHTPRCPGSSLSMKGSSQWHINSNLQDQSCGELNINRASFILYFLIFSYPLQHTHTLSF